MTTRNTYDRDIDVDVLSKTQFLTVIPGPLLKRSKWRAGQWVTYVQSSDLDFTVEASDGTTACGFLLFSSERYGYGAPGPSYGSPNNYTNIQPGQGSNNAVTMITDGVRAAFRLYETVALNGGGVRAGGTLTYALNQQLYLSENGLICGDDPANLIAAGITDPLPVGIVSAVPSLKNGMKLCADIRR